MCTIVSQTLIITLKISWGSCENFGIDSTDHNFQCGFLQVPMDYYDSTAGAARLAVIKYSATAPRKLGTIFFNPGHPLHPSFAFFHSHLIFVGGPGQSGLETISKFGQSFSQGFHSAFDIVSWDPRGVGYTL